MKKLENVGKLLTAEQQKKIVGGADDCIDRGGTCSSGGTGESCCPGTTCKEQYPGSGYFCQ